MPYLVVELTENGCVALEIARDLQDAADSIHANLMMYEDMKVGDEPLTLSNAFVALRPVKKNPPKNLLKGWAHAYSAYSAYVVKVGALSLTFDTGMFVLEF